jgi:dTDP-4-dehydrorhamnose 3,5-epimerase
MPSGGTVRGSEEVGLEGVVLVRLEPHADARGSLTETYRAEWLLGARPMVQANLSISAPNVLRGLHFHRGQADYWCVLAGVAFVALVDLRMGSPTESRSAQIRIDAGQERLGLYIPPGVAHGFYAETEVHLQYLVDATFTGEDEFGLAWDDPHADIAWPGPDPILSERDRTNPSFDEARERAPAFGR